MSLQSDLLARDRAHVLHPLHDVRAYDAGRVWVRGEGARLVDADGRECIDGLAGLWNVVLGHGRRDLADAAAAQMRTLAFASGYAGNATLPAIELAERLSSLVYPSINRFFFTSGGAEANETAFKIARSYWKLRGRPGKTKIIARRLAYHGTTLAAMSATGLDAYWPLFEPRVSGFVHVPPPDPYRGSAGPGRSVGLDAADALEAAIRREGADTVAMFIAEPVMGVGGVLVPPDDYFPRVREICRRHDVLLAADEVITGFGRTGRWFALEHWGVEPDLVQFAKAVTSGYFPFGGVGVSDAVADVLDRADDPWMHALTYSGHPVGCAVALRTIAVLAGENLVAEAARKGDYLLEGLKQRLGSHPHVGDIRGKGLMCAIELVEDRDRKRPFPAADQIGARVHAAALDRGLLTRVRGDVVPLAPPFVTPDALLDRIGDILADAVRAVLG